MIEIIIMFKRDKKGCLEQVVNWRPLPPLSRSLALLPPLRFQCNGGRVRCSGGGNASDRESRDGGRQLAGADLDNKTFGLRNFAIYRPRCSRMRDARK